MPTILFVLIGVIVLLPEFVLGASEVAKLPQANKSATNISYPNIKAIKSNPYLTINFYKDGKEVGVWPFSDSDGGRWLKDKSDPVTGMVTLYYGDFLIGKGLIIGNMKQGKWFEYDENNGKLIGEYIYKDDERSGSYKEYDESGTLSEEGMFISGDAYAYEKGHHKTFYPTGELKSECEGVENHGEGSYLEKGCVYYHEKGGVEKRDENGTEREYNDAGGVVKETTWNNKQDGDIKTYYDSGKLKSVSHIHPMGVEQDENTVEYYESGQVSREYVKTFTGTSRRNEKRDGLDWSKLVQHEEEKRYYESGELKVHILKKSETESNWTMTSHGSSSSMTIVNSGTHEEFYKSGKPLLSGKYTNRPMFRYYEPAGTWKCFYPSGSRKMLVNFTDYQQSSVLGEEYFESGKKMRLVLYDNKTLQDQTFTVNGEKNADLSYTDTEIISRIINLLKRRIMECGN